MSKPEMIRGRLLFDLAAYLKATGYVPEAVFSKVGFSIDTLAGYDSMVPVEAPLELMELCASETRQDDFGLRLAQYRGMPDIGVLTLLLREKTQLKDVLSTIAMSFYLHCNALYLSVIEEGHTVILAADLVSKGSGLSRQSSEMIVSAINHMLRSMLGEHWRPRGVTFRHARVLSVSTYVEYLGVQPEFDQEYNALILDPRDLQLPIHSLVKPAGDDKLLSLGSAAVSDEVFLYRVEQLLVLCLPRGEAKAVLLAKLLHVDRRTLHRRLARAGFTFTDLLQKIRGEFALQYVRGSTRPFSEIALLVGFESLAVFSRWFRRFAGVSPSHYRLNASKEA